MFSGAASWPALALVGSEPAESDNNALVYLEAIFPGDSERLPCSGVLISDQEVYTAGHCLMREEDGKAARQVKVCVGRRKPFNQPGEACFVATKISARLRSDYGSGRDLGRVRLPEPVPVFFLGLDTTRPLSSREELQIISSLAAGKPAPSVEVLSFGARSFASPSVGKKGVLKKARLSWSPFQNQWIVTAEGTARWVGDDGAALLVLWNGHWRLMGVLTNANPEMFYSVEPFFDPCQPPQAPPRQPSLLMTSSLRFASINLSGCRSEECARPFLARSREIIARGVRAGDPDILYQQALQLEGSESVTMMHKAAASGSGEAALVLHDWYLSGRFVPRDPAQARQWLEKAVTTGSADALWVASRIYRKKRRQYIEKAALNGHRTAQLAMAKIHADNPSLYYEWLMRSARQGEPEAQFLLAQSFLDGYGVRQDNYLGRQWMKLSAGLGHVPAQEYLDTHPDPLLDHYALPEE
jgi:hypothetical protein